MEWRASHILIKDKALADALLKRLRKGETLAALAKEFSTCPSKGKGGDLGWFGAGQMVRPFEETVKRLRPGGLSGVVRTQFGFHIIRKTGER